MIPGEKIIVEMPTPLIKCDTSAVHLYSQIDSLWYDAEFEFRPMENNIRKYEIVADWRLGVEYSLEVDSAAFVDIYGLVSKPYKQGIKVKALDEFSSITMNISGVEAVDTTIIVQMLSSQDAVTREVRVKNGKAEFKYVTPGKFYLRAFIDANGNGIWDIGDYDSDRQPEWLSYTKSPAGVRFAPAGDFA